MTLGPVGARIVRLLQQALSPAQLHVTDESHLHSGHAGARPEGESHFRVRVVARAFAGKSRLERHRMIHRVLADELQDRVHALTIEAVADEA
ncbi:MAG: BolA family transcriptional regulator [Pseudomonadota bacterium]|nr:BolA family transcriptional regulator [Pseudomonadota bacterium]